MRNTIVTLVLASALAAPHAHAAAMNPNPLGLTPRSPAEETKPNVVELRLGGGTVGEFFGTGSGPVLTAVYERRFSETLSLGAQVARSSTKFSSWDGSDGEYGYKFTHNTLTGRASYHVNEFIDDERVDLFGGGLLGYNSFSMSAFGPSVERPLAKTGYVIVGAYTGGRFWFNPRFGVNAEIGYNHGLYSAYGYGGFSWATGSVGVSARF